MAIESFPMTIQLGMKKFHGHIFVAPEKLYFVCIKKGGGWTDVVGGQVGGLVGATIKVSGSKSTGEIPDLDAANLKPLEQAVAENEGSMAMEPHQIKVIKHTLWWRLIRFNGKRYGLPNGMSKDLRRALGKWARSHNVKTKGLS